MCYAYRRIVVKVGTSTLTYPTGLINIRHLERLVKVLADLKNAGCEVLLVTSGAIGVGVGKLGLEKRPHDIPLKQAAAAVGQCELMNLYEKLFAEYNHTVAQLLLTRDVVEQTRRLENVSNTIDTLLRLKVIPVVNENDTVSVEEIEAVVTFGDNDTLSAIVAGIARADLLVLLSDIDGLFDADPHKTSDVHLIPRVREVTEDLYGIAGGAGTAGGTGGMVTKLRAAEIAMDGGADMAILNGANPALLYELLEGRPAGTLFSKK